MNKHLSAIRRAGFGSPFTLTKAIRRVRAIAADGTRASLTGGCFRAGNLRIYTEFCSADGESGRLRQPGPGKVRFRKASGIAGGEGSRAMERGVAAAQDGTRREGGLASPRHRRAIEGAFAGRAVRSRLRTKDGESSICCFSKSIDLERAQHQRRVVSVLRSTWRARNTPGSVDASHCSFETLAHNSRRAAQHF